VILWLNPVGGLAGDMLLGALLDLGAPLDEVRAAVASTGLTGWQLDALPVSAGAITATRAVVTVTDSATARTALTLRQIVECARPEPVAAMAARAVAAIAAVEAGLHGEDVETVHLHEIGGLDTVVDTVGVAAALHSLGVTELHCGPLPLGAGVIETRHGALPAPAPATVALLARVGALVTGHPAGGETVTPTGAALLVAADARFGPVPPMALTGVGYGAGTRPAERPNVVQALLGSAVGAVGSQVLLETNVDDVTGEVLGHLLTRAMAAGAADAWISPIVMKKSRPAHTVHVLAPFDREAELVRLVLSETGSLGLRRTVVDKLALDRQVITVELDGHRIAVKSGPWGAKPEHDDLVAAGAALGLPLRTVTARALQAFDELAGSAYQQEETR
jgi:hypothetical protein